MSYYTIFNTLTEVWWATKRQIHKSPIAEGRIVRPALPEILGAIAIGTQLRSNLLIFLANVR